jgi:predicted O-linked N-acetylglucosamine transferase (SPINDLY family)
MNMATFEKAEQLFREGRLKDASLILDILTDSHEADACLLELSALVQHNLGCNEKARGYIKRALELEPENHKFYFLEALIYEALSCMPEAVAAYQKSISLKPDYVSSLTNLASIFSRNGKLSKAEELCRKALDAVPENFESNLILGNILVVMGKTEEAIDFFKKAGDICQDNPAGRSNALFSMHYSYAYSTEEIFQAHKKYGEELAAKYKDYPAPHPVGSSGKIRIAYLSADFKRHSVAYFIEPVIHFHDRNKFEIFCYSEVRKPDEITERFKSMPVNWNDIAGMDNEALYKKVCSDKIDILVDLGGHTNTRMPLFAMRPAPIQVTYLGYINTTGILSMDYIFTDELADPPGSESLHTEKLARLSGCSLCFAPPESAPECAPSPALNNGYITFGSLNNFSKINDKVVDAWSNILKQTTGSHLIVKNKSLSDENMREEFLDKFVQQGIDAERIELLGFEPQLKNHLEIYNRIDVALDTFPFSGVTTTCEALWMGVPVLTLLGDRYTSRIASSILNAVSLTPYIAKSVQEYVQKAVFQAQSLEMLKDLRLALRPMMAASNLCDAQGMTSEMEKFYTSFVEEAGQSPAP